MKIHLLSQKLLSNLLREVHDEVEVVNGRKLWAKHFVGTEEMREVGFSVGFGNIAITEWINK